LARYNFDNFDYIRNTFQNVMVNKIIKENNLPFCTEAYNRLLPQITDVLLANEISYSYYITNANCKSNDAVEKLRPALQALKLKPNDKVALATIEFQLYHMTDITEDRKSLLDTLDYFEKEMKDTDVAGMIKKTKWRNYLVLAKKYFMSNQGKEGTYYLALFESSSKYLLLDRSFRVQIEDAYYESAHYYVRFNNRAMAKKIVDKGLLYIPNSNMIQSATYVMPTQKPKITKRMMTKAQYDAYMKKNGPDR